MQLVLSNSELININTFLQRLQGKQVRIEVCSRLNIGFRQSFTVTLEKSGENYSFSSKTGEVMMFLNPSEAENLTSDHSSITMIYGDNLITVRYSRTR